MRTIIIFFAIGIPMVSLWIYVDEKSRRQKKEIDDFNKNQTISLLSGFPTNAQLDSEEGEHSNKVLEVLGEDS